MSFVNSHEFQEIKESIKEKKISKPLSSGTKVNKANNINKQIGPLMNIRTKSSFSLFQIIIGYIISIVNTTIFAFFLYFTKLHIKFFTEFSRLFLSIIGLSFLISCSVGFFVLISFRTYNEMDSLIAVMTFFGFIGWSLVYYAISTLLNSYILGFLMTLWTFISAGIFIGIIWPRNLGWDGEKVHSD